MNNTLNNYETILPTSFQSGSAPQYYYYIFQELGKYCALICMQTIIPPHQESEKNTLHFHPVHDRETTSLFILQQQMEQTSVKRLFKNNVTISHLSKAYKQIAVRCIL